MLGASEIECGVHERDVRECLGEVAQLALRARIVLLGQETDVVSQVEEVLEETARVGETAEEDQVVRKPEAAGEERAFAWRKTVLGARRIVAQHQTIDGEPLFDGLDGAANARIVGR